MIKVGPDGKLTTMRDTPAGIRKKAARVNTRGGPWNDGASLSIRPAAADSAFRAGTWSLGFPFSLIFCRTRRGFLDVRGTPPLTLSP